MSRKLPRSFFWVDQQIVRDGRWMKLGCHARLAYIAIAASCDRDGLSIWSRSKLMELAGCKDPEDWQSQVIELHGHGLIEVLLENTPRAIRLLSLDGIVQEPERPTSPSRIRSAERPIVIHTHTSIHLAGEKGTHVESGNSD